MPEWIFYVFLALGLWAITQILDGAIIKNYIKNPLTYTFITKLLLGLFALILIPFFGLEIISSTQFIFAIIAGVLFVYGLLPYLKALTFEEVTRIAPLWNLTPILVLVFATLFLNETLTKNQYIGFALLVIGGFTISLKKIKNTFTLSKGFGLMMLTAVIIAVYYILTKYVFLTEDFINNFILIRIGTIFGAASLLLIKKYRKEFLKTFFVISNKAKAMVVSQVSLDFIAIASISYAILLGPISLINALDGVGPFFTLALALIISFKYPKLLKEELDKKIILQKIIAMAILALGVYFINV